METRRSSALDATLEDGKTKTDSGCRELADTEESMNGGWVRDDRCRTYRCTGVSLTECSGDELRSGGRHSHKLDTSFAFQILTLHGPRSIVSLGH